MLEANRVIISLVIFQFSNLSLFIRLVTTFAACHAPVNTDQVRNIYIYIYIYIWFACMKAGVEVFCG